jgi:hypothetical protein
MKWHGLTWIQFERQRKKILKKNQIPFLQEKQQFYKLFKQELIARPLVNKF